MPRPQLPRLRQEASDEVKCRLEDALSRADKGLGYLTDEILGRGSVQKWMRDDKLPLPVEIAQRLVTNAFVGNEYHEFGKALDRSHTGIIDASTLGDLLDVIAKGSPPSGEPAVSAPRALSGDPVSTMLRRIRKRLPRVSADALRIFEQEARRAIDQHAGGYEIIPKPEIVELDARLAALAAAYDRSHLA